MSAWGFGLKLCVGFWSEIFVGFKFLDLLRSGFRVLDWVHGCCEDRLSCMHVSGD